MTKFTSIFRVVIISSVLLGFISAPGQGAFLSKEGVVLIMQMQSESSGSADAIIVNTNSSVNSYPSMEEEMEMYIELHSELPLAFFFPNPSNGIVWIEHNFGADATVVIKDVSGRVVFEAKSLNAKKLDLTEFAKGNYYIQVISNERQITKSLEII